MRQLIFFIFIILPTAVFSQMSGKVVDKKSGDPIPYANIWVENSNIGTTSNLEGKFDFKENVDKKTLIVTALGYESLNFIIEPTNLKIELVPKTYELAEVVAHPKKIIGRKVNEFSKSSVHGSFICSEVAPYIIAQYFEYLPIYEKTPYLRKIAILTESESGASTFNLRFILANGKGEPTDDILRKNLVIRAEEGKEKTVVDLSDFPVSIPREGLFIAVEWLTIESNKYNFVYNESRESKKKLSRINLNPNIGYLNSKNLGKNWIYKGGTWRKVTADRFTNFAIELTLTN